MLLALQLLAGVDSGPALVRGSVRDGATGTPLAGATVVVGAGPMSVTDSHGNYVVRVTAPGPQPLTARRAGYAVLAMRVILPERGTLELDLSLQPLPLRLPLIAIHSERSRSGETTSTALWNPERHVDAVGLAEHPLTVERDVLMTLAGGDVSVRPETPGGIAVRGGASDQVRYSLDGIPVLNPHHIGALLGPWNPDVLSGAGLSESAPSLAVPAGLSGALEASTRTAGDVVSARGGFSSSQLRFAVDGPLAAGSSFLLSVRAAAPMAFASRDETYLRGASNDWIAAITAPVFGGTLELLGTGSDDDASVSRGALPVATSPDPSTRNALSWSNQSLGARWMKATANRSSTLSAWRSSNDAEYSWRGDTTLLGLESVRRDFGAQAVLSVASDHATTVAGLRFESIDTRYRTDSTARPDVAPSLELDATTPMATAFIEQSRVLAPHWSLGIGGAVVSIRWRSTVEPRATVTWTPRTSLTLTVTGSRTHQFVQSLRNAESVVSHVAPAELFVGAGDGRVPVATSSNAAFAAALRLSPAATLSVRAFVRSMDGLVAVSQMTREPFVTQVDAGMLRDATARAGGVSADASWRTSRVSLDLRYGWTTVMYESSGSRYAPEHAVRHQVTGGVSAWLTPTMQLRVGGVVALGRRATPVDGGVEWESCNLLDRGCEFSGVPRSTPALAGSLALPGYIRTDVSVRKQWQLGMNSRRAELALFGTVTNIFNRRNVLNFTDADGARTALQLRPLAPLVIGLDWRF